MNYLDFEKPLAEIEGKAEELRALARANPAMDITPAVVTGLNAKITQFAFDRERLDQAAAAPPSGAAPAQPPRRQ